MYGHVKNAKWILYAIWANQCATCAMNATGTPIHLTYCILQTNDNTAAPMVTISTIDRR